MIMKLVRPIFLFIWVIFMVFMIMDTSSAILKNTIIKADLLALLPKGKSQTLIEGERFLRDTKLSQRLVILLGSDNPSFAKQALSDLKVYMSGQNIKTEQVDLSTMVADQAALFSKLYQYRSGLLADKDRQLLLNRQFDSFSKRSLEAVMSPFTTLGNINLNADPFFLFPSYVKSLIPDMAMKLNASNELYTVEDQKTWYMVQVIVEGDPFSLGIQESFTGPLKVFLKDIEHKYKVDVLKTGALFYTDSGFQSANSEINTYSLISLFLIVALVLLVFRSLSPIVLSLVVMGSGALAGIWITYKIFGHIHMIALLFGCSLMGMTVDYVIHYFCSRYPSDTPEETLKSIFPALSLSMLSSAVGYLVLCFIPFPGVQQMALLASVGLIFAFITLYYVGPFFGKRIKIQNDDGIVRFLNYLAYLGSCKNTRSWIMAVTFLMLVFGMSNVRFSDDIRDFQALDKSLKHEEENIQRLCCVDPLGPFIVVEGDTFDQMLEKEERICEILSTPPVRYIAKLLPSYARYRSNKAHVAGLYQHELSKFYKALDIKKLYNNAQLGLNNAPLKTEHDTFKLPDYWRYLVYQTDDGKWRGRMILGAPLDMDFQEKLLKQEAIYVDLMGEYSKVFKNYRQLTLQMAGFIILAFFSILTLIKELKSAFMILKPVMLSIILSGAILALSVPLNIFHIMGIFITLCIGLDYAIFLYWRKETVTKNHQLLANALCALTTLASFGLLAFSSTGAVHSFGLSVFLGISLNLIFTTVFLGKAHA